MALILRAVMVAFAGAVLGAVIAKALDSSSSAVLWTAAVVAVACIAAEAVVERKVMSNRRKPKGPSDQPVPGRTGIYIKGGQRITTQRNRIHGQDQGIVDEDGEDNRHDENDID